MGSSYQDSFKSGFDQPTDQTRSTSIKPIYPQPGYYGPSFGQSSFSAPYPAPLPPPGAAPARHPPGRGTYSSYETSPRPNHQREDSGNTIPSIISMYGSESPRTSVDHAMEVEMLRETPRRDLPPGAFQPLVGSPPRPIPPMLPPLNFSPPRIGPYSPPPISHGSNRPVSPPVGARYTPGLPSRPRPQPIVDSRFDYTQWENMDNQTPIQADFATQFSQQMRIQGSSSPPILQQYSTHPYNQYANPSYNQVPTTDYHSLDTAIAPISPFSSVPFASSVLEQDLFRNDSIGTDQQTNDQAEEEFVDPSFLSNVATYVKDKVPLSSNIKGGIEYDATFTGQQIISVIHDMLPDLQVVDRLYALDISNTLLQSLWFNEVEWGNEPLIDASGPLLYSFSEDMSYRDIPTGVLTSITPCYSPACRGNPGDRSSCYSYSCRNPIQPYTPPIIQPTSQAKASEPYEFPNWNSYVGEAIAVDSLDPKEVKRQNSIFELIQSEFKYLRDLKFLRSEFLSLKGKDIIPANRIDQFLADVLLNWDEIVQHSEELSRKLIVRQKEKYIIPNVGDIVLQCFTDLQTPAVYAVANAPMAGLKRKNEQEDNPNFKQFLDDFLDHEKEQFGSKRGIDTLHDPLTFRLPRYPMWLEAIHKHTPENHPDREMLEAAIEVCKATAAEANKQIDIKTRKVEALKFARGIIKRNIYNDLDLDNPCRLVYHSGPIIMSRETAGIVTEVECFMILFDHYLVITKPAVNNKYVMYRRPIPLELIKTHTNSFREAPVKRAASLLRTGGGNSVPTLCPIILQVLGRHESPLTVFVVQQQNREQWEQHLTSAIKVHLEHCFDNPTVGLRQISEKTFGLAGAPGVPHAGKPNCSAPFSLSDESALIFATSPAGLFIGYRGGALSKVVHLEDITQCSILTEYKMVLVLARGILYAYALEALVPSIHGGGGDPPSPSPVRINNRQPALFFRAGKIKDSQTGQMKTLVLYYKRNGIKETIFKTFEPTTNNPRNHSNTSRFLNSFSSKNNEWFQMKREFFLPCVVDSVKFMRSKLAIVTAKSGVEILDLHSLETLSVPNFKNSSGDQLLKLAKKVEEYRPMGMFRTQEGNFLLVYDRVGFHVDRHGEPMTVGLGLFEWESRLESVAYQAPYVFGFSSQMIEIRNAATGHLVHIILGVDIAMTYDGNPIDPDFGALTHGERLDTRINFTMRVNNYHILWEIVTTTY